MTTPVHINRGVGRRYAARVRLPGAKKWTVLPGFTKGYDAAFNKLAKAFVNQKWKRGQVIMLADYYDPIALVEMRR